jgi:hypothetical protein
LLENGVKQILLALERVERDEDLTYEVHSPFHCIVLYSMLCGGSDSEFQPSLVKHAAQLNHVHHVTVEYIRMSLLVTKVVHSWTALWMLTTCCKACSSFI